MWEIWILFVLFFSKAQSLRQLLTGSCLFSKLASYFLFLLVVIFCAYEYIVRVMLSAITPLLMTDLHYTPQAFGILSSVYFYAYAPVQLFSGYLHNRFGVIRITTMAIGICIFSTYLFAHVDNYFILLCCRFMMGFASGFAFVGAYILVSKIFPYHRWGLMYGLIQLLGAFSAMLGQNLLAQLAVHFDWRNLVTDLAVIGLALLISLACFWKKNIAHSDTKLKTNGLLQTITRLCASKQVIFIALYSLLSWGPITIYTTLWGPTFLLANYGWSNATAVSVVSMSWVGIALGSPLFGWLTNTINNRRFPMLLAVLIGLIASPILIYFPIKNYGVQCLLAFCIGLATSGQPIAFIAIQESVPKQFASVAIGLNNFAVIIGGAIFQALSSLLLKYHAQTITYNPLKNINSLLSHLQHSFMLVIACYLFSTIIVLFGIHETASQFLIKKSRQPGGTS